MVLMQQFLHPGAGVRRHVTATVDHFGHGRDGDPSRLGDVRQSGTPGLRSHRFLSVVRPPVGVSRRRHRRHEWNRSTVRQPGTEFVRTGAAGPPDAGVACTDSARVTIIPSSPVPDCPFEKVSVASGVDRGLFVSLTERLERALQYAVADVLTGRQLET